MCLYGEYFMSTTMNEQFSFVSKSSLQCILCTLQCSTHIYSPFSRSKSKKNTFNAVLHLHASMPLRTLRLLVSYRIDHVFLHFRQIRHCKLLSFFNSKLFFETESLPCTGLWTFIHWVRQIRKNRLKSQSYQVSGIGSR